MISKIEDYLRSYVSFPDDKYYLPLALFSALEHCWDECFDEVPYLSVSASVKSAGKTRLLELLSFLAGDNRAIMVDGSVTIAALYTEIEQRKVILIDESERLHNPHSRFRPILNGGYRRGQVVLRKIGGQNVKFSIYCPKVFSHIGDLHDSLRDRCIVVQMQRTMGGHRKEFDRNVAQSEGVIIAQALREKLSGNLDKIKHAYRQYHDLYPTLGFLRDRDKEIWKPLFSLCQVLAPARIPALERAAIDIATLKTLPVRRFDTLADEEKRIEELEYGEKLLRDAITVMHGEQKIATSVLIARLRELSTSPWRSYEGNGITDDAAGAAMLAKLLKLFGVQPTTIRVKPKSEPQSTAKGYFLEDLIAGAGRAGVSIPDVKGRNPVTQPEAPLALPTSSDNQESQLASAP